jgi:hypothetical protein
LSTNAHLAGFGLAFPSLHKPQAAGPSHLKFDPDEGRDSRVTKWSDETPGIPRLGFALCLPIQIGYVVEPKTVNGFCFRSAMPFLGKLLLHFAPSEELTHGC